MAIGQASDICEVILTNGDLFMDIGVLKKRIRVLESEKEKSVEVGKNPPNSRATYRTTVGSPECMEIDKDIIVVKYKPSTTYVVSHGDARKCLNNM